MTQTLGRYTVERQIGSGAMGDVFAATDPELQRSVAIKVLRPELSAQPELVKRFEREARSLAALEHPNIVSVHSVEAVDGTRFLTMELVEGESLADRLASRKPPLRELFDLGIQLADAVAAAHERGITHRDLKPGNVMISKEGRVKVLDFGLAKKVVEDPDDSRFTDNSLTSEGAVVGTVSYMSPEQAEGRAIDHRSDIFSLGVILYEMVTGELPFQGDSRVAILAAIINDAPLPVTHRDPKLPRHLDRIIRLTLEKDRERRLQSAKDLRNELEQLLREITTAHLPEPATAPRRRRARAYTLVGTAALGIAIGAAATAGLMTDDDPTIGLGHISRVTGSPALETHPAISPKGEFVVYSAGMPGSRRVYSRSVTGGKEIALADELEGDQVTPAFLPDGRVAFCCQGKCWTASPTGGRLKTLTGVTSARGMSFSRNGEQVVCVIGNKLVSHRLADGEVFEIIEKPELNAPSLSPDGTRIAFVAGNPQFAFNTAQIGNIGASNVWVVAADGGNPVLVAEGNLNASPVWRTDELLLFVSNRGGARDVYSVEIGRGNQPRGDPRRLTTGLDVHTFSLSEDGNKMAFAEFRTAANIWSLPIPTGDSPLSTRDAQQITHGNQSIEGLSTSADNRYLLYDSNAAGNQDIYRLDLTTGAERQMTEDPDEDFLAEYSPDGDEIAFYSFREGSRDLYVMEADGSHVEQVTRGPAQDRYPKWSPDGNRIAFYSDRTGKQEIWVTERTKKGADWQTPVKWTKADGAQYGRWSNDGTTLLYTQRNQLFTIRAPGETPRALLPDPVAGPDWPFPNWSRDGTTIYYKADDRDSVSQILAIPPEGGAPKPLVIFDRLSVRNEFACSDDRFYFTITEQSCDIFTLELR